MSQERNSISSILSCTQYQKPKKQKRISFSRNMVFQEFDEDGTTRTYQEKIDDETSSMLMSLEESDCNLFDTTVYDAATMDISSFLSPSNSPKTPSAGFRTLSQSPMATTTLGSPVNGSPVSCKVIDIPNIPDLSMVAPSSDDVPNGSSPHSVTPIIIRTPEVSLSSLPTPYIRTPINGNLKVVSPTKVSPLSTSIVGTPVVDSPIVSIESKFDQMDTSTGDCEPYAQDPSKTVPTKDLSNDSLSLLATSLIATPKVAPAQMSPLTTPVAGTPTVDSQVVNSPKFSFEAKSIQIDTINMDTSTGYDEHDAQNSEKTVSSNGITNGSLSLFASPVIRTPEISSSSLPSPYLRTPINDNLKVVSPKVSPLSTSIINTEIVGTPIVTKNFVDTPIVDCSKVYVEAESIQMDTSTGDDELDAQDPSKTVSSNDLSNDSLSILATSLIATPKVAPASESPLTTTVADTPTVDAQVVNSPKVIDGQIVGTPISSTKIVDSSKVSALPSIVPSSDDMPNGSSPRSVTPITRTPEVSSSSLPTPCIRTPKRRSMEMNTPTCGMASSICSLDSISFSSGGTLEQSRRDVLDSTCLSMIVPFTEVNDHCDSILVYAEEKSFLSSSYEEEPSIRAPKSTNYSTTFIASLFNETCAESELESVDECFDFIENSIFSKLPSNVLDFTSIDPKLTKYVVDLNDDCATTEFMAKNFLVHLKYSIIDAEKAEVQLEDVSIECTIDKKIASYNHWLLSTYSPHLLAKPKDEKFIQLMKKVVAGHFDIFKVEYLNKSNPLSIIIKGLHKFFYRSEALFVDLYNTCSFHEWKIINADIRNFEIAFETFGMRYTLWLVLSFDLIAYPTDNITVKFGVHKADIKRYPYYLFHRVMRAVEPGTNDYIGRIIKTAKKFVLDWRHNHSKKQIRLSIHPCRRTLGGDQTRNFNQTNI